LSERRKCPEQAASPWLSRSRFNSLRGAPTDGHRNERLTSASNVEYKPDPFVRKSGIPQLTLIPAPVKTTIRFASRRSWTTPSKALSKDVPDEAASTPSPPPPPPPLGTSSKGGLPHRRKGFSLSGFRRIISAPTRSFRSSSWDHNQKGT
jgi:hypothetical protein